MSEGVIFDIKEFTIHDGPGIRVTVFLKGCPLRCEWCHNPEGLSFKPELMVWESSCIRCGKCQEKCKHPECKIFSRCIKTCPQGLVKVVGEFIDSKELAANLKRYKNFLEMNNGGITISGGEPLAQSKFLVDLLGELKPLHTAVETSGYGSHALFIKAAELADLILFDIKHTDPEVHKHFTGVDNRIILKNLDSLIQSGKRFIARIPLIPGVNDTEETMENIATILKNASGLERVELLPYNSFAGAKYAAVGRKYIISFNEKAKVEILNKSFQKYDIQCYVM